VKRRGAGFEWPEGLFTPDPTCRRHGCAAEFPPPPPGVEVLWRIDGVELRTYVCRDRVLAYRCRAGSISRVEWAYRLRLEREHAWAVRRADRLLSRAVGAVEHLAGDRLLVTLRREVRILEPYHCANGILVHGAGRLRYAGTRENALARATEMGWRLPKPGHEALLAVAG